ncbi:MAG: phosphoribosylanthranilate isomerase [Arcobacteraceae bacterium]|nr:phosphoribosylanthranilate isomerase [Arcobacteraceae bacterium]
MKAKICGITNLEDALMACKAGADALGFVFYEKSPRAVTKEQVREIAKSLPPFIKRVGLFVNVDTDYVDEVCDFCGLDLAQIHFEASQDFFDSLKTPYIRVIRATCKEDILKYSGEYLLIDAFVESYGGEGKRVALEWFEGVDCSKIILAGGLNPDNLKELNGYGFYGVDVSSGVEASKGKKDREKVEAFVRNSKLDGRL